MLKKFLQPPDSEKTSEIFKETSSKSMLISTWMKKQQQVSSVSGYWEVRTALYMVYV